MNVNLNSPPHKEKIIMDSQDMARALIRVSHEILERNKGTQHLALVGIRTGGVYLAQRLVSRIHDIEQVNVPVGELDITLYRDDLSIRQDQPEVKKTLIPFDISEMVIVLIDDVLFTGRTIRAALNEIFDYGRPASIRLAALVDRGGRELPVVANYVGTTIDLLKDKMLALEQNENGKLSLSLYEKIPLGL